MKYARFFVPALIAAAVAFGGYRAAIGDEAPPPVASFGVLQTMDAEQVQAEAKAWLQQVGKTDAATMKQFDAIWSQTSRTALERLADTFALGNPAVARLMADAGSGQAPAPLTAPEILNDAKASAFFKSNFALAYGRLLTHRRVYEQALDVLETTSAGKVIDPGAYLFHVAICQHALTHKTDAKETIDRILEDVVAVPERYKTVGVLMLLDMEAWKSKDLGAVARLMDNSERRLDLARAGEKTQGIQKQIIRRLDELIKELENKAKAGGGGGGGGS